MSWFVRELEGRKGRSLLKQEIPGRHLAPVGIRLGQRVFDLEVRNGILGLTRFRVLETLATEFLMKLA
ncbi:MAG: hypothetical protein HC925_07780 [Coleofasciculaceae cyanobacterium SM2_3_26]|nr:hypothetical protein [Coleofasciculaceae cyanobacterium SM2_3_26]